MDSLDYSYITNTNKISSIVDNGSLTNAIEDYPGSSLVYTYDSNGNMTFDGAKNTNITYSSTLNIPQKVVFSPQNRIYYHYIPAGIKLVKHTVPSPEPDIITHYVGNIVYEGSTLIYIITEEGRLLPSGTGEERVFNYEYNLKDHLGNTRVTFMGTDPAEVVQTTSYYPFGLVMAQSDNYPVGDPLKNKYLYNGKEHQDDVLAGSSLNWYDYGARFYDPQIGRWHVQDRFLEKYYDNTPYNYTLNNPIKFIDINGDSTTYVDSKGNTLVQNQDGRKDIVVIRDQNLSKFENDVKGYDQNEVLDKPETSDKLNEYGYNINDMKYNAHSQYPIPGNDDYNLGYEAGYSGNYKRESASEKKSFGRAIVEGILEVGGGSDEGGGSYFFTGKNMGDLHGIQDARNGKMNMFTPQIKNNPPQIKRILNIPMGIPIRKVN